MAWSSRRSFQVSAARIRSAGRDGSPINDPERITVAILPPRFSACIRRSCRTGETSWTKDESARACLKSVSRIHAMTFCLFATTFWLGLFLSMMERLPCLRMPIFSSACICPSATRAEIPARFAASASVSARASLNTNTRRSFARISSKICVRASLTGHLVFTTLHTNDAPSAVTRLVDIGIATYLVSSTLSLVVAQRLIRRLCDRCKEAYEPEPAIRERFKITEELLYRAKGCDACSTTGYKGRLGVYEVMTLSRDMRNTIAKGALAHVLKDTAVADGMSTLWDEGLQKVREGATSLEELESVILLDR